MSQPTRRQFLETLAGVVALGSHTLAMQQPGPAGIPLRPLGKTGVSIPIVGYGGWDSVANKSDEESITLMHEAIDLGVTFFDNAWEYHSGRAEEVMGRALASPGRRDKVFLMTKACARDYAGFQRHLDDSLRRLRTDRIDLLQFHAVQYDGDVQRIFDSDTGGLKAALEAQKAGKVRFLGFSGHMDPKVHLEMINRPHQWDTVQMPLNILDAHHLSFEKTVLPVARQKGIGVLGMKALGGQNARIVRDLKVDWELCRRYAMSLPVSTVICGLQTRDELQGIVRVARGFTPLTSEKVDELLKMSAPRAAGGEIEQYKNRKSGYGCSYHAGVLKGEGRMA
jgi:predicted aldo/keto reductase-like oxidoreductase